jgi:hypothetical protein
MIAGNSTVLQVAKDSYSGDTPAAASSGFRQIRFSSATMDYIPNKVREKVLTGNIGESRLDTMGVKSEGQISALARPDDLGFFLYMLLGKQELVETDVFKFTPHPTDLPSFTVRLDKGAGVYTYPGCILGSMSFSAEPEDYLSIQLSVSGYGENFSTGKIAPVQPSTQRAFKFNQGKVSIGGSELVDITSIGFSYNNSVETSIQTTSTGLHYKRPVPNTRVITTDLSCLYSSLSETFRQSYFKTDNIFSVTLEFITDEGTAGDLHSLKIQIPNCQVTSCSVPVNDGNSIKQSISLSAIDVGSGELIIFLLDNGLNVLY